MRHRTIVYSLALTSLIILVSAPVLGESLSQINPTQQQQTIDAAIGQLFTQTAEAQQQSGMTQTIEAGFQQAQTATAAFPLTVQSGFNQALTATADALATQAAANLPTPMVAPPLNAPQIVLRPDLPEDAYTSDDLREAADVISLRLGALNIGGASVEIQDDGSILVVLPPIPETDTNGVIQAIQQVGLLEFVDFSGLGQQAAEFVGRTIWTTEQEATYERWQAPEPEDDRAINPLTDEPFVTVLTGAGLQDARPEVSPQVPDQWQVTFELTPEGAAIFRPFTAAHLNEPLAIALDGVVLSAPTIQAPIDDSGVIYGNFTQADVEKLTAQITSGTLPIPLRVESVELVPVTLTPTQTGTPDTTATLLAATQVASAGTATATRTPLPPNFPTPTTAQINVAEQVFEGGRMLWIQPTQQIWVLVVTETGRGTWTVYQDTFEEGDPESDPSIVSPAGLLQPMRGFGKLWRENPEVREALGWATTPEFGYVSPYEYHPGGEMVDGDYVPGPGYHVLYSLYGEQFRFNETDGTWDLGSR